MSILKYMRQTVVAAGIGALLMGIFAFAAGDSLKFWDPVDKLTWADFQAEPPASGGMRAALTNSTIRLDFNQVSENTFTVNVVTAMDRSKSWGYNDKRSDYILGHEQCHFDITEYWGRRMRKDLITTKYTLKNIKSKIETIQKSNINALKDMQDQYDAETKHSINKEQQMQWEKKVAGLLEDMKDYTNPNVTVMIKK
jgi:hypothetical protein